MIERVHEHIISELQQNTRTDTVFIAISVFLNLVNLAVNSSIASSRDSNILTKITVMIIFILLSIVVNSAVVMGLLKGKQNRTMLLSGLVEMYKDQGVDKYYDVRLLKNYNIRYYIFTVVVVFLGVVSVIIPLVIS